MPAPPRANPEIHTGRHWFYDGVTSFAFFALAFLGLRLAKTIGGPIGALFYLTLTFGTGWVFARSAWRGLTSDRENAGRK